MYRVRYVADSFQGIERGENKDRSFVISEGNRSLYVVFDGVSSTPEANACIDVATTVISQEFNTCSLPNLFQRANEEILSRGLGEGSSTYVALLVDTERGDIRMSSLGDSRIYEIQTENLSVCTEDDSVAGEPHVITRGLGFRDMDKAYFKEITRPLQPSRFVLCSDGFYEFIEHDENEVHRICSFSRLGSIPKALERVIKGHNADDATYLIVDISTR